MKDRAIILEIDSAIGMIDIMLSSRDIVSGSVKYNGPKANIRFPVMLPKMERKNNTAISLCSFIVPSASA